jgi:glutathione S-transferase
MPVDPNAPVRISAFNWVPPFAQGQVRDLRPRWALEEAGIAYAVRKLDARARGFKPVQGSWRDTDGRELG